MKYLFTDNVLHSTIIIWDDWFSVMEDGVSLERIKMDKRFTMLKSFERDEKNRKITFVIFKRN
jgi:hypothetical protein